MKENIKVAIRKLISPSMRFELRETAAWLKEQLNLARIWNWEFTRLPNRFDSTYKILYLGRKVHREWANSILFDIRNSSDRTQIGANLSSHTVLVSELPIPGALSVPKYLRAIVPLGRPIEEIMAGYDSELRRSLRKHRSSYRMQQVLDNSEVGRLNLDMLEPFAIARHGSFAMKLPLERVRRIAMEYGKLDLLLKENEEVGCLLAYSYVYAGKHYWFIDSFGYTEAVFSDPKRLREANQYLKNRLDAFHSNGQSRMASITTTSAFAPHVRTTEYSSGRDGGGQCQKRSACEAIILSISGCQKLAPRSFSGIPRSSPLNGVN